MDKLEIVGADTFDNCVTNEQSKSYDKSPALQINRVRLHFRCSCIHPAWPMVAWPNQTTNLMRKISFRITLCAMSLTLWSGAARAVEVPTPFYSVTGTNGTGGGTTDFNLLPVFDPSGSTALTDLAASGLFSFGTGPGGWAGGSISNAATGQAGSQVLAGTLGAGGVVSNFTLTVWLRQPSAAINNYRLGLISTGAPPTSSSADGDKLFLGENGLGGLMFYVNNQNGNSVGTSIAGPNTWNNNGTLGALQLGTWYFVAITYSAQSNVCVLYSGNQFNTAIQAATYTGSGGNLGGPLDLSAATSICLMNRFSGGRCFPGEMDYFNLYTNALTWYQIVAVQNSPPYPPPPPHLWAFIYISPTNTFFAHSTTGVTIYEQVEESEGPFFYQWQTDNGSGGALTNIPYATNYYYAFNSDTPGTYHFGCVVTNACCMVTNTTVVYVLPAITAPPVINCTAGARVLTWTNGGVLLEATNVSGPWITNTHTSPYTFSPTGAAKFYRTYYP